VTADGETVGLFLQGSGTLLYRSVDPIEFPLVQFNVRKNTGLSAEKSGNTLTVRQTFTRALWIAPGRTLPTLPVSGPTGSNLDAALREHLQKFGRSRWQPLSWIEGPFSGGGKSPVLAQVEGGKELLIYLFDERRNRSESLYALHESSSNDAEARKFLYATVLSDQPVGRDRRDPVRPPFFLTDVRCEVEASSGKDARVTVLETIVPQGQPQDVFDFDMLSTVYDVVGAGILQPRTFHVREVADEAGRALAFEHAGDQLRVRLPAPAAPDKPLKLRFAIDGDFLVHPHGDNFWLLGTGSWFPQPPLGGLYYTWHATVKAPKPFVPFSSGKTVSRRSEGAFNIVETEIDQPVQFAVVLAGDYSFEEESREGITIRVATYALKNARAMKQLRGLAFDIIDYYQRFLGPFPFSEFQILEIDSLGFGQAPPGVMFITKEAFNPLMGDMNQLFSGGVNERFAHEIAHQYWGYVVKMPSHEEQWLTEAFAEYSAALFLKEVKGKATYNSIVSHWKARASYATDKAPIPLANLVQTPGDPATHFAIRTGLIYDKGAYLLYTLHKELGDDMFLTFLKSYQKSFRWKFGSTKTVAGLLQFLTKKDYTPFFEANYWGTGMPTN
jgi:hypothetical protein